jgi:fused signal recognition particle receptor
MWGWLKKKFGETAPETSDAAKSAPPAANESPATREPETSSISTPIEVLPAPASNAPAHVTPPPATENIASPAQEKKSWLDKLKSGLAVTRNKLGLNVLFAGKLDEDTLEQLESQLLMADCGMPATQHLLDDLRKRWKQAGGEGDPRAMLVDSLTELLKPLEQPLPERAEKPFVVMIVGVNGAGKTTSIGKLAKHLQQSGASVLLAAGDTFRAAAREQLAIWGERNTRPQSCSTRSAPVKRAISMS